jgi:proline dehydrogenase
MPVLKFAARSYVAGETLDDAVRVTRTLRMQRLNTTIGFWNGADQAPEQAAEQYLAGLEQLATFDENDYLSIKLPAIQFNKELIKKIAAAADESQRRIHFDSHDIEYVTRKIGICEELIQRHPKLDIGFTLPGRWKRSLEDADWACEKKLFVRVVKGQWADPSDPNANSEQGFLNVIDRLSGRARKVAVATHDPKLARKALLHLKAAGTPCELELLHGLPMRGCLEVARQLDVPVRVYIPYGEAFLPYALSKLRRNPKILWWLVRDSLSAIGQR